MAYSLVTRVSRSSDGILSRHRPALVGDGIIVAVAVFVDVGFGLEVGFGVGVAGGGSGFSVAIMLFTVGVKTGVSLAYGDGVIEGGKVGILVVDDNTVAPVFLIPSSVEAHPTPEKAITRSVNSRMRQKERMRTFLHKKSCLICGFYRRGIAQTIAHFLCNNNESGEKSDI
jgi:hypothetical protein